MLKRHSDQNLSASTSGSQSRPTSDWSASPSPSASMPPSPISFMDPFLPSELQIAFPSSQPSGSFSSLRHLLSGRVLPEASLISDLEIIPLLNEIEFDLIQRQVQVDFLDRLPARVAYRGILQMLDSPIEMDSTSFSTTHIDGCDSACESCFQLAHCSVAKEILGTEWALAVQQSQINPSWSALFSKDAEG